jgi:hypothetical protein
MPERRKYVDGIRVWRRRALKNGAWRSNDWEQLSELCVEQKSKHPKVHGMFVCRAHPHLLIVVNAGGNIRVWNIHKRVVVATIREQSERVRAYTFSLIRFSPMHACWRHTCVDQALSRYAQSFTQSLKFACVFSIIVQESV